MSVPEIRKNWEHSVRRNLVRPGTNPDALTVNFHECNGRLSSWPQCPQRNIREGGNYENRIKTFCFEDGDCFLRLMRLEAACTVAQRVAKEAETNRMAEWKQDLASRAWKEAYDDWVSAYNNHLGCQRSRQADGVFNALLAARVFRNGPSMSEHERMGRNPAYAEEPIVGIQRHSRAP